MVRGPCATFFCVVRDVVHGYSPFVYFSKRRAIHSRPYGSVFRRVSVSRGVFANHSVVESMLQGGVTLVYATISLGAFLSTFRVVLVVTARYATYSLNVFRSTGFRGVEF